MKTVRISLNSIDKVKSFVNDLSKFDVDFDLVSGRYVIDAKSIMGIFSLDLSKPIRTYALSDQIARHTGSPPAFRSGGTVSAYRNAEPAVMAGSFSYGLRPSQPQRMISRAETAVSTISSIVPASFSSDLRIAFRTGFVTGCFATKMVQQSS